MNPQMVHYNQHLQAVYQYLSRSTKSNIAQAVRNELRWLWNHHEAVVLIQQQLVKHKEAAKGLNTKDLAQAGKYKVKRDPAQYVEWRADRVKTLLGKVGRLLENL